MIKIDINLVFTIINLLVLYLLMKKFLFGPIIKVMDVRKAMIDQQFAGAKEQEDQAKALKEQYEGALKSAREESFQIMEQARRGQSTGRQNCGRYTGKGICNACQSAGGHQHRARECYASDER